MYNINIYICELPLGQIRRMDYTLCTNGRKSDQPSKCYYCRLTSLCTRIWIAGPGFWSIRRVRISFYRFVKIQIVNYTSFVYIYIYVYIGKCSVRVVFNVICATGWCLCGIYFFYSKIVEKSLRYFFHHYYIFSGTKHQTKRLISKRNKQWAVLLRASTSRDQFILHYIMLTNYARLFLFAAGPFLFFFFVSYNYANDPPFL